MAARRSRRGHPVRRLNLGRAERRELERMVGDGRSEQRIARRARVLLAMATAQTVVQELAERVEMSRHGIWYLCRRYEDGSLATNLC